MTEVPREGLASDDDVGPEPVGGCREPGPVPLEGGARPGLRGAQRGGGRGIRQRRHLGHGALEPRADVAQVGGGDPRERCDPGALEVRDGLLDGRRDGLEHPHEVGLPPRVEGRRWEQQVEPRTQHLRGEEHRVALPVAQHGELPVHAGHRGAEQPVVDLRRDGQRAEALGVDRPPALGEPGERERELRRRRTRSNRGSHPAGRSTRGMSSDVRNEVASRHSQNSAPRRSRSVASDVMPPR